MPSRESATSPELMAEIYQIQYHSADLLRALMTWDLTYIEGDIARIRLSLAAVESKVASLESKVTTA